MPPTDTLLFERDSAGVATLTINRPHVNNALDWPTMHAFAAAVHDLASGIGDLRAVIVAGAGTKAFCSGGDLRDLHDHPTEEDGARLAALMGDAMDALERLPVPVMAAINGYAVGGGCEIALACDLRFADERVRMGLVQLKLGLTPSWGAGQRLLRLVGHARAMDMLLSARWYEADDLLAFGLVNRVVPAGEALAAARAYAAQIAAWDPSAVRAVKALLHAGRTLSYAEALAAERALFPPLWAGPAHLEAVTRLVKGE